ncbi:MAG: hypothetical protein Q9170_005252, partial [Blastenia crenularia]
MPESSKLKLPLGDNETANSPAPSDLDNDQRPLLIADQDLVPTIPAASPPKPTNWYTEILHLLRIPGLRFCFIVFFITRLALIAKAFVYQHASESFGWEMSTTTWLRVSQAVGASLVTLLALPLLNTILHKRGLQAQRLDLAVLRASLLVAAIGFAVLWEARESWMLLLALFICGLSEAIQPANQGLATSLITR